MSRGTQMGLFDAPAAAPAKQAKDRKPCLTCGSTDHQWWDRVCRQRVHLPIVQCVACSVYREQVYREAVTVLVAYGWDKRAALEAFPEEPEWGDDGIMFVRRAIAWSDWPRDASLFWDGRPYRGEVLDPMNEEQRRRAWGADMRKGGEP